MNTKVQIAIGDEEINHIGVDLSFGGGCVVFRDNRGNEIILEKRTLERGLGVIEGERLIALERAGG